jgi:hypothetical protein
MEDNIPNIHLVSFADGVFKNRAKGFINEVEKMDVFNSINVSAHQHLMTSMSIIKIIIVNLFTIILEIWLLGLEAADCTSAIRANSRK